MGNEILNTFVVKEAGKEMTVVIPRSGDSSYDDYLEEAQREKTAIQLRNRPERPAPKHSRKEVAAILGEYSKYRRRKNSDSPRKYF